MMVIQKWMLPLSHQPWKQVYLAILLPNIIGVPKLNTRHLVQKWGPR